MAGIKSLMKDTAIYGVSSIVGRFLNWMLTPLYTRIFLDAEYGVVSYVYSVTSLVLILLIYGMETGFFRFANHDRWHDPMQVYGTCMTSLAISSTAFVALVACFLGPVAGWMECAAHPSYVMVMAACVAIDAFVALPYSYLRYCKRPFRFATIRLVNIGVNIGFNLFFLVACPWLMRHAPGTVDWFYDPDYGVGYIFLSALLASATNLVMMWPEITACRYSINGTLWREIMRYSLPLLALGLAGIMNQHLPNIRFPYLYPDRTAAMGQLGIYAANMKLAIIMLLFLQAFRFAYEPFIFAQSKENSAGKNEVYAKTMKYFVIFCLFVYLAVSFFLPLLAHFIGRDYQSGIAVVPVIMLGELFFGIFFNLSVWYKLTDKTIYGMWFSFLGLAVTVVLNIILVPRMGYWGCAVASLASYGSMMLASFFVGRRQNPIHYPVGRILVYFGLAAAMMAVGYWLLPYISVRVILLAIYCGLVLRFEHFPIPRLRR